MIRELNTINRIYQLDLTGVYNDGIVLDIPVKDYEILEFVTVLSCNISHNASISSDNTKLILRDVEGFPFEDGTEIKPDQKGVAYLQVYYSEKPFEPDPEHFTLVPELVIKYKKAGIPMPPNKNPELWDQITKDEKGQRLPRGKK